MLLFRAPRSGRDPRYVRTRGAPLPSTSRAHLATSPVSLYLVIMQSVYASAVATDQRAHLLVQARTWRASPRVRLGRVLPSQRVGVRLPLLWGGQIGTARLGLNLFVVFYRWRPYRERIPGTMRVDVSDVFPPLLALPCLVVFYPVEQRTPGTAPMFDHGQCRSSEQATDGDLRVPHQMGPPDPDPATPGTHRITGDDLLWSHPGDAAITDGREDPPCLRFLEDLIS